jgi:m7GpppX diphosphatase
MSDPLRSPDLLLCRPECTAQCLSLSKDHATLLLRTRGSDGQTIRSLLKLTVVPSHCDELAPSLEAGGLSVERLQDALTDEDSAKILSFLSSFSFRLSSESGAEYSYYQASTKSFWNNPFAAVWRKPAKETFQVELISPASDRQIQRSLPSPSMCLMEETPLLYDLVTKPYIASVVAGGSLSWIQNVVECKKEVDRLLLNNQFYVLNVDTKWKSHPDPILTPREEWRDHNAVQDLYCLAIVKDSSIASIRDLRASHIPILKSMLSEAPKAIQDIYGVPRDQLRIFAHYQPQFYHFHVHYTRLENQIGCQVERGHLVSDIIQNLELDSEYYVKRTISYNLKTSDQLYVLLKEAER